MVGDSISTGYRANPEVGWPALVQQENPGPVGGLDVTSLADVGSGYLSVGVRGETFGSQLAAGATAATDLVVIFGSENDRGADDAALVRAAAEVYAQARRAAPGAAVVVVGPTPNSLAPEPARLAVRDALESAAAAAGLEFVDPIAQRWFMDDLGGFIGEDGAHPTAAGQRYLAQKFGVLISAALDRHPQG